MTHAGEVTRLEDRLTTCGCGVVFTQHRFAATPWWLPRLCEGCTAQTELEDRLARAQLAEAAARGREAERLARAATTLNVRPKYAEATLGNFTLHGTAEDRAAQGRVLQIARRYLGRWPDVEPILVFRGAPGTGKGHIAWAIARDLAATHGAVVEVVKLADLVRRIRATWRGTGETEEQVLDAYRSRDLLVLDEVSTHSFYGQNVHQHLYDVIDHRAEYQRPTILTSNETDDGLAAILRPALWDRLFDGGGILDFGTASWRSRPREAA